MQVFHGKIITCDEKNTVANYLVEKEGRIAYIGDELPARFEMIPPIELEERVVLPAFVDSHIHYSSFSAFHVLVPVDNLDSNAMILEQLRNVVQNAKDNIIVGFGASKFGVVEGHLILKEQLDAVCPNKPLCVIGYDARSAVVNSVFIELIRSKAEKLRGYNESTGEMTQEAYSVVMDVVTKGYSTRKLIENMMSTADFIASKGIGLMNSSTGRGFGRDYDLDMEKSVAKGLDNGIQMRVSYQTSDFSKTSKKEFSRLVFGNLDGAFGNLDAALINEYTNCSNKGVTYYSDEEVTEFCKAANRAGYQIALHAVGDAAFNQAVNALETALEDYPRFDHRHMILYAALPTERGLKICEKHNIMLSIQPTIVSYPKNVYEFLEEELGEERAKGINPLKTCLKHNVKMCFNSGAPSAIPDPIQWIYQACNHNNPDESIPVFEALRMATYYGAKSCFEEKERGSLEIGKTCDLVVLDTDPYSVSPHDLKDIKVVQLYLKGKPYERSRTGAMATMLRGMFPQ